MPTVCPNCRKECGPDVTHCPHCGFHVAEEILRQRVTLLERRLETRGEAWDEIVKLKAEIAKLREGQTFHPVSHRDAICPDCGKPLGEHVIVRQRDGMEIICPKEEADGNNTCAKA